MKTKIILLAIAAGWIMQLTLAAAPLNVEKSAKSGTKAVPKAKPLVMTALPLVWKSSAVLKNDQILRVGNLSSRSWTTASGWHPGASAFLTESPQPKLDGLPLIWAGQEPSR